VSNAIDRPFHQTLTRIRSIRVSQRHDDDRLDQILGQVLQTHLLKLVWAQIRTEFRSQVEDERPDAIFSKDQPLRHTTVLIEVTCQFAG